jgi:hypothetical protein
MIIAIFRQNKRNAVYKMIESIATDELTCDTVAIKDK